MVNEQESENPYQSPKLEPEPRFVLTRLPYALLCAARGYVAEMRRTGSKPIDHVLVWLAIMLLSAAFLAVAVSLLSYLLRDFLP